MTDFRTRLFQSWWRMRRAMTLGVRGVVEREDGAIALVRHTYVRGFYLPGGGVETGETVAAALARELAEEAGVRLTAPPELVGVYSNHRAFRNDHVLLYRARAGGWTDCESAHGREIAECFWCEPGDLPEDTTPGTRRRLLELYGGGPRDALW